MAGAARRASWPWRVLIGLIYFRDSTRFGFPTGDTIEQFRISMRLVWRQFPRAVSPVPSEGSFAIAATTALGLCALACRLVCVPRFRSGRGRRARRRRLHLHLGARRRSQPRSRSRRCGSAPRSSRSPRCAWLTPATIRPGWASGDSRCGRHFPLRSRAHCSPRPAPSRWPRTCPAPATRHCSTPATASGDVTEVVSPLVDIRSRLVNRGNVELFTVATDTPRYLRPDRRSASSTAAAGRPCPKTPAPADRNAGRRRSQRRDRAAADHHHASSAASWRRPPARRSSASVAGSHLLWANEAGALYVDGGLEPGYQYQVTSADYDPIADGACVPPRSTAHRTRSTTPCPQPPDEVRDLALQVTAGAATPYDKARALAGLVPHASSSTRPTVQRGHSNDAMLNFLQHPQGLLRAVLRHVRGDGPSRRAADAGDGRLHAGRAARRRRCTTSPAATPTPGPRCGSTATAGCCSSRRPAAARQAPSSTPASRPAQEEGNGTAGRHRLRRRRRRRRSRPSIPTRSAGDRRANRADDTPRHRARRPRRTSGTRRRSDPRSRSCWLIVAWVVAMPRCHQPLVAAPSTATRPNGSPRVGCNRAVAARWPARRACRRLDADGVREGRSTSAGPRRSRSPGS